jgi:hypothetical protein
MPDNPDDPICVGCAKRPYELDEYVQMVTEPPDESEPQKFVMASELGQVMLKAKKYVIQEEGTYNPANGHFLCTYCYIKNGQPTGSHGWVCP